MSYLDLPFNPSPTNGHTEILNIIAKKFSYEKYLEIGTKFNKCFDQIICPIKVGVDPVQGGTHRMFSDEYFKNYDETFDLIFIDGDHHHDQVYRDIQNSINRLNKNGMIVMHDCCPPNLEFESQKLCGTAWRAFCHYRQNENYDMIVGDFDMGVGILRIGKNSNVINLPKNFRELTYDDMTNHKYDWLNLTSAESVLKWLDKLLLQITMKYLIIGGTGSLGKKLIEKYLPENDVHAYSRDEAKHWTLKNEFINSDLSKRVVTDKSLKFHVGDVRDQQRLKNVIQTIMPDVIILASALKHVDTCEISPNESLSTNVIGTQNVINVVNDMSFKIKLLLVSTDKACSPVNVYGMCKALSERMITSQSINENSNIKYLAVRYGNVLESRGSIIPLFKYQSINSDYISVTDPEMTRFVMTLNQSVDLIDNALKFGESGQIFIPKLFSMKIGDLAEIFSEKYKKPIKIIGTRPGEKKHEDLINESESVRTHFNHGFYIIENAYSKGNSPRFTYSSSDKDCLMSKEQLFNHLTNLKIIQMNLNEFNGLKIEEINTLKS